MRSLSLSLSLSLSPFTWQNGKVQPHEVVWTRGKFGEGGKVYNSKSEKRGRVEQKKAMASKVDRKRKGSGGEETEKKKVKRGCKYYVPLSANNDMKSMMQGLKNCGHIKCMQRAVDDGYGGRMVEEEVLKEVWGFPSPNMVKRLEVLWKFAKKEGGETERRFRRTAFQQARFLFSYQTNTDFFTFLCREKLYEKTGLEDATVTSIKKDYVLRLMKTDMQNKAEMIKECIVHFKPTELTRSLAVLQCVERRDIESARAVELTTWSNQASPVGPMMDLVLKLIKYGGYQFLDLLEKAGFSIESVIAEDRDGETLKQAVIYGEHGIARHLVFRGMKHTNLLLFGRWINVKPVCPIARSWFWGRTSGETDDWYKTMSVNRGICFDMVVNDFEIPINLYCTRDEFADFPAK